MALKILLIRFQISPNYFRSPIIAIQHWTKRKQTVFNVPKRKQFEWRHNTRHCRPYKVSTPQQCAFPTVVRRTPFKPHERKVFVCLIWFFTSTQQSFSYAGRFFLGLTSTKLGWMCLAQGPQRSDAGEARTRYPSVSSQAFYHWATASQYAHRYPNTKTTNRKSKTQCKIISLYFLRENSAGLERMHTILSKKQDVTQKGSTTNGHFRPIVISAHVNFGP